MIAGLYEPFQRWAENGTVWLYSDPHFNDPDLPRAITAEEQIKNINSKVGKNDTLIILGDVGDVNCVRRLRGHKVLIMGNHDQGRTNYECRNFYTDLHVSEFPTRADAQKHLDCLYSGYKHEIYLKNYGTIKHDLWLCLSHNLLFNEIYEGPLMISEKIILSHEPIDVPWAFNFHGHDHSCPSKPGHFNCCAEMINYTPVNLNQLIKQGIVASTPSIHRITINEATKRARKYK